MSSQEAQPNRNSEKQKMLAGDLYNAEDPILIAERLHAVALLHKYNSTPHHPATHPPLLAEILGSLGEHSTIRPPFFCDYGYNIHLGRGVFLNFNCVLLDVNTIEIGDRTQIGPAVQIYTADHPRNLEARRANLESGKPIRIGRDVWIGGGAIIGAGSVVTHDVPSGITVIGNPARKKEAPAG